MNKMSYIKLETAEDLQKFLKDIASKAVDHSLNETNDKYINAYKKSYSRDKDMFNLKEQDNSPEADEESEPAEEPKQSVQTDASKTFGASFDALIRAINKLRSGKSTKDSAVRDQAAIYYERLAEPEREVLVMFMKEMAEILTGETDGAEAQDPEDDPLNIKVSKTKEDTPEEVSQSAAPAEKPKAKEKETIKVSAEEDISPPIKVNESQLDIALLQKIRKLMMS
jgi:hypothetical protein